MYSMDDAAIRVEKVYKNFRLPHEKVSSVKSLFVSGLKRIGNQRSFETQRALKNISFDIKHGEFFGIVGRNGSGKSTLLKILAGIYQPTSGKVRVNGRLVPFIELGVGFNPELTGRQNVYLNGALLGFSEKEIDKQYDEIVGFAELEKFMDQKLKNYSSGMQVRLAFSMAIRAQADILLVDEVLAVGDADFQRKCFDYFKKLKKDQKTVVFVSHNMDAVREYCDRAMLINDSEIVYIGDTDKASEKYIKLFMDEVPSSVPPAAGPEDRWGDFAVKITDIKIEVEDKIIKIHETIKAMVDIESPIVGVRIRDAAGKDITGTNTKLENKNLSQLKKGQQLTVSWTMSNCLGDGRYSVDPAILHNDEITVADWWNNAAEFTIKRKRHIPYAIDPSFQVTVTM